MMMQTRALGVPLEVGRVGGVEGVRGVESTIETTCEEAGVGVL